MTCHSPSFVSRRQGPAVQHLSWRCSSLHPCAHGRFIRPGVSHPLHTSSGSGFITSAMTGIVSVPCGGFSATGDGGRMPEGIRSALASCTVGCSGSRVDRASSIRTCGSDTSLFQRTAKTPRFLSTVASRSPAVLDAPKLKRFAVVASSLSFVIIMR